MTFSEWLGGSGPSEPPEPDPMAALEAALSAVPEQPRLVDPTNPAEHVTEAQARELFPLLDTFRGRMDFRARVLAMRDEGLCPGCVSTLGNLMGEARAAWGSN